MGSGASKGQDVLSTQNGRTKGKAGPTEVASGPLEASGVVNPSTDGAARVDSEQPARPLGGGPPIVEAKAGKSLVRAKGQLRDIPREAFNTEGLMYLDVSWNQIASVSSGAFQMLQDLEFLDLSFNGLEKLPESISYLSLLKVLRLSGNKLEQLPISISDMALVELYLDDNKLVDLPKELKGIRSLRVLDLTGNKIIHVGRTLGTLKSMEHLSLDKNHIKSLPSDIGKLILLRTLRVAHNELETIPLELGLCMCLEELDVAYNKLKYLPSQIADCRRLRIVRAARNKIKILPDEFGFLSNIEELYIANNELLELPRPVQWTKIRIVDVQNNDLTSIPSAIGFTNTIQKVEVAGNPRLRIPRAVLDAGTKCLASYLQTIGEQHRLIDEHIQHFNDPTGGDDVEDDATEAAVKSQVNQDAIADSRDQMHVQNQGLAVNRLTSMTEAVSKSGGAVSMDERRKMRVKEVEMIKSFLMSDPARYRRIMATRKERQKIFKDESERTRRMLVARGLTYGNQMMQMISKALDSKILVLRSMGLRAIPPEVERIGGLTVADFTNNQLREIDVAVVTNESIEVLNLSRNLLETLPIETTLPNLHVLHVGFNALNSLPYSISKSSNLEVLIAANNNLSDLPSEFGILPLTDLYLSENVFKEIPYCIWSMRTLEKLSIACNSFVTVPPEIGLLTGLRFLDLSFNMISKLPVELESLNVLERLNVSFNPLGPTMPAVLPTIMSLIELNLDYTGIREIPPSMGDLMNLEGLQLEGNRLQAPFDALYKKNPLLLVQVHNENTTELDMSDCKLAALPPFIGKIRDLVSLDLRNNHLTTLPLELGQCRNLRYLELEGNPLEYPFSHVIRPPYGAMAAFHLLDGSIESLDLSNANLPDLPDAIVSLHRDKLLEINLSNNVMVMLPYRMAELSALRSITVDANKLTDFPGVLCSMVTLEAIQLAGNEITEIPEAIGALTALTSLVLDSNQITKLPEAIGKLRRLEVLSVPNNKIEWLPFIGELENLRMLDISCNDLKDLPPAIGSLERLEFLDARINQFSELPEELGNCEALRLLSLSNNQLGRLPESLGSLRRLNVLRLGANGLTRLPYSLCLLNELEEIQLVGNPLPTVPSELNVRGVDRCRRLLMFYSKIFEPMETSIMRGRSRASLSSVPLASTASFMPAIAEDSMGAPITKRKSIQFNESDRNPIGASAPPGRDYSIAPMPSLDTDVGLGMVPPPPPPPPFDGRAPASVGVRPARPARTVRVTIEGEEASAPTLPPPGAENFAGASVLPPPPPPEDPRGQRPLYEAF